MGELQDQPKGRAPEGWKRTKRYDIVVRASDFSPYAAIEVKHRVYSVSKRVTEDFKRISNAVNFKPNGKDAFKMGIFAFYTVFDEDNTTRSEKKEIIEKLYSDLKAELKKYKGKAEVNKGTIDPISFTHNREIVWGGGCFILSPP